MSDHIEVQPADATAPATIDLRAAAVGTVGGTLEWAEQNRVSINDALTEHGALYLSGAGVGSRRDFAALRDLLFERRAAYQEQATPRTDFGAEVYSSTDLPPKQPIRQHNENSYTLTFPGKLLFGCIASPEEGGATTVADVRGVLADLPAEIRERMAATGWQLRRAYNDMVGLPWQKAFRTDQQADVERYCADNEIGCRWVNGQLHTEQRRPAVISHPRSGARVWFNHAAFWSEWSLEPTVRRLLLNEFGPQGLPFRTLYGDDTELGEAEARLINAAYDRATRRRAWRNGDVLLVDNLLSSHGREAYVGHREIVVAMGEPVALADCAYDGPAVGI